MSMDALVWLFVGMSTLISGYVSHRITKWYWKKKVDKLEKKINDLYDKAKSTP